jgi:DNA-binding response OmpR family regulator
MQENNPPTQRNRIIDDFIPTIMLICGDEDNMRTWSNILRTDFQIVVVKPQDLGIMVSKGKPNIILIDLFNDDYDENNICQAIRDNYSVPILILTERTRENHLLKLYKAGMDDYLSKPISPALLLAKIKSILHRSAHRLPGEIELNVNGWVLLISKRTLKKNDKVIKLSKLECRLLYLMMRNEGQVINVEYIAEQLWGETNTGEGMLVRNLIYHLRHRIEVDSNSPKLIETIPGRGYMLKLV